MNGWDRVIAATVARRAELELTQKELALKAGVAERTVQNLEAGKRPQPLIRGKIERALGWPSGEMDRIAAKQPEPEPELPPSLLADIYATFPDEEGRQRAIRLFRRTLAAGLPEAGLPEAGVPAERQGRRAG